MSLLQRCLAQPHTLFLWIALIFGAMNVVLNPPFMGVDEENHFARMMGFAKGKLFESASVSAPFAGQVQTETSRMRKFFGHDGYVGGRDFFHDQNDKFKFRDIYNDFLAYAPADNGGATSTFYPYNRAVIYPPLAYLGALPFVHVAVKSGENPLVILYIARICILLTSSLLMYIAIRIAPVLKWQLFLLALLQTCVFIRSGVNADPHVFAYAFLFIALILHTMHTPETISRPNIISLAILATLLCISKTAYILLPGMFLLLDGSKFTSSKQRVFSTLTIVLLPIILGLIWSLVAGIHYHEIPIGNNGYIERAPGVDERAQILFCITHPPAFLHSQLVTFAKLWPLYMGQMIAMVGNSQVDISLPFDLLSVTILLFPFLAFLPVLNWKEANASPHNNTDFKIMLWQRGLCFVLFIVSVQFICLMIYAGNSVVSAEEITGLQGRYFIPLLPLLFLAASHNVTKKISTGINAAIIVYVVSILCYSVYSLLSNDYVLF